MSKLPINTDISPFHLLLASLIILPILVFKFSIANMPTVILYVTGMIAYSYSYYKRESEEKGLRVWESIKSELPSFGKADIGFWHIVVFVAIAWPLFWMLWVMIEGIMFGSG